MAFYGPGAAARQTHAVEQRAGWRPPPRLRVQVEDGVIRPAGRVAVVIPTFNYARFLQPALDSVFAQTVAPSEVIVVDDGSDDCPEAVLAAHPGVRFIRQPHLGLGAARNTGWRAATSEFVMFLDADDRLRPEAIAVNLEQFASYPECALVYGAYATLKLATGSAEQVTFETPGPDPVAGFLRGNRIGMHGAVMYRREVLEELGGFDTDLPACEDYELYLRAVFRYPMACEPAVLADYVRHDQNMSLDSARMLRSALAVLRRYEAAARSRPEWLQALREGQRGLITGHATGWAQAYLWALGTRGQGVLTRRGLALTTIAPLAMARAVVHPLLTGLVGRAARGLARQLRR